MVRSSVVLLAALSLSAASLQAQGFNNLYLGTGAGNPGVSTGNRNTALGEFALSSNTSGSDNTAVGSNACLANTNGNSNTGVGSFALASNTTGQVNTAVGSGTLPANTSGVANSGFGVNALNSNTTGSSNTALGFQALFANVTGNSNTGVGANALGNATGSNNIALGRSAGFNIINGTNNIHIGNIAPGNESNTIRIGNTQTATFIAGINGATASGGVQVFVDAAGQLGTLTSSKRFKEDVRDMGETSDALLLLRPVTFHYKAPYDDGARLLQYGLIAEEVAKVAPELVQYDPTGQPFTVRYHALNAMLLNELQKQHAKVEEQAAELARQKALLEEQEARIRRLEALLPR
ncbi:MAG TPA: tail fiber domain-containing protein [Thermoanaerobaculia bacterium]